MPSTCEGREKVGALKGSVSIIMGYFVADSGSGSRKTDYFFPVAKELKRLWFHILLGSDPSGWTAVTARTGPTSGSSWSPRWRPKRATQEFGGQKRASTKEQEANYGTSLGIIQNTYTYIYAYTDSPKVLFFLLQDGCKSAGAQQAGHILGLDLELQEAAESAGPGPCQRAFRTVDSKKLELRMVV